ncbi:(+)-neomenthol dehydrogenase-like isoform X2 [Pistacia vera]|uniref:(+)-neomenthol dehydrogenase-like isoform X2 n=1 Tax=Pistacia vera TaxID=55513 RepID=UPI0012630BAD|nr:(+)-neomenthol dehydrogenase-like isoform X2 [Pistacia vera]
MAEALSNFLATKRYAVVTGGNKGIGFEICRQLASKGVIVLVTARDEKKGLEAVERLGDYGLSHLVLFHRLDVTDPASIASLANFITTQFPKLDILVNNAGTAGAVKDPDAFSRAVKLAGGWPAEHINWNEILTQTLEMAEECLSTNYYGVKRMAEALVPLLQLSDSPRIVNVTSLLGTLKNVPGESVKGVLLDVNRLTEERLDELLNKFLKDFKEGWLDKEGWPVYQSAYIVSKAAMNAYTRILAKKCPRFMINCVSPGFVMTDMNCNVGLLTVAEGAESCVRVALLPHGGPSALYFSRNQVTTF